MSKRLLQLRAWVVFVLVALIVLMPLLSRGYILTLDMVFTPQLRMPTSVSSSYLLRALLHGLNFALPSDAIEKLLLFVILLLSGIGAHMLCGQLTADSKRLTVKTRAAAKTLAVNRLPYTIAAYFAGIFYMINPFTYDRFMAGQYQVVFGYALLPWFVRALFRFLASPDLRRTFALAAWAVGISIVSIHTIGFIGLVSAVAAGYVVWQNRNDCALLVRLLRCGLLALALFALVSSYWLVPLVFGHGTTAAEIGGFGASDRAAFATLGGSVFGRIVDVLRLQGFWAESRGLFTLPQDAIPLWNVLTYFVWFLVVIGIVSLWRTGRRLAVVTLGVGAGIAAVLGAGIMNGWLAAHVPLFAGYREPHKFVALIALAYAVFAGFGVSAVLRFLRKSGGKAFLVIGSVAVLILPFAWTPTFAWGFNNQLTPVQYPTSWYMVNKRLDSDPGSFKVLFLPWHLYMYFSFAGRIIANPAPQFFDKTAIVSNNPELGGITPPPNAVDTDINAILANAASSTNLGRQLAKAHIKYVILDKDDDYTAYNYLNRQDGMKLIMKSETLDLYVNTRY